MSTSRAECLDDNQILDLVRHRLDAPQAADLTRHLNDCSWCRGVMDAVVAEQSSNQDLFATDPRAPAAPALEPGNVVGRYRIERLLGAGAMGVVYAAQDPELDRAVALKLIRGGSHSASVARRLVRESRAMAKLAHPNVVTVFDVGTHDGRVFLAMEYVDGDTLRAWLQRAPRSWREVVVVFAQAARGLAAAHDAQVIHRDFKPDNVLVDRAGRVRVSDFGLARSGFGDGSAASDDAVELALGVTITRAGSLVGTPAYMAPEQMQGQPADARSDQFSFCVALWEAIYGQRPFAGDTFAELQQAVLGGALPAPPPGKAVPGWLHRAIARGLALAPGDRHPSMAALLGELERDRSKARRILGVSLAAAAVVGVLALAGARGEPAPCSGTSRELAGAWDHGVRAALTAAFAASGKPFAADAAARTAATLNTYARDWAAMKQESCEQTRRSLQTPDIATARDICLDARRQELRALTALLVRADDVLISRAPQVAAALSPIADCADLSALSRARPPADPAARQRLADATRDMASASALFKAGRDAEAGQLAERVARVAAQVGARPLEARALLMRGQTQSRLGDGDAAEKTLREAVLAAEAGGDDDLAAKAWAKLTLVLARRPDQMAQALEAERHARAAAERTRDDELRADELSMRAALLSGMRSQEALDSILEADAILRRIGAPPYELAGAASTLATTYLEFERYEEAHSAAERHVALSREALGDHHPDLGNAYTVLGVTDEALGKVADAEASFRKALAIVEAAYGAGAPRTSVPLERLAAFLAAAGRRDEALATYRQLGVAAAAGNDTLMVARARLSVGQILLDLERLDEAEAALAEVVDQFEREFPADPERRIALADLGNTLLRRDRPAEALARFDSGLALAEQASDGSALEKIVLLNGIAEAQLALRQHAASVKACERALALVDKDGEIDRADIGMVLARALWGGGQRQRALVTAKQSRDIYATLGEADKASAAAAWIARPR